MELGRIVEALSQPDAYRHPADGITVHHTHISVVFLAGPYAYKVKKPLDLGFLDFTSLEKRRHFCLEEVRLNTRLAPGVYLGVLPIRARGGDVFVGAEPISEQSGQAGSNEAGPGPGDGGGCRDASVEPEGQLVEYAVWMERLPDEATLEARVLRGEVEPSLVRAIARRIAAFHEDADSGERIAACGRWEVVEGNARENFEQSAAQVGTTVSSAVFERLRALTETALDRLHLLIERRAVSGVPRDTHGDLRLDHVYLFPERAAPRDLVVVDCIEFNERFRYADPVADMAFLAMDVAFYGRRDLSRQFADAYFEASRDAEGRGLLPFYSSYRAAVRGKVEGFEATSPDVPEDERAEALRTSRGHWLLALFELEEPGRRPCLILIGGLPGTGKSTLARELARRAGFELVASDVVRKELAGIDPSRPAGAAFGGGLYTPDWNERTYGECLRRAIQLLFAGKRVIVDASFRESARRGRFLDEARRWGVPGLFLLCTADPDVVRQRLRDRRGDASDADWQVYRRAVELWEEPRALTREATLEIDTSSGTKDAAGDALEVFRTHGLLETADGAVPMKA